MRLAIALVVLASLMVPAGAAQAPEYVLRITDHAFVPSTLTIPAGQRVQLSVRNERRQPSEFESFELNREKVVAPASTVTVWVGPLPAGKYKIFDDFNPSTAGWIVATAAPPALAR